jgi:superkiller protein 3
LPAATPAPTDTADSHIARGLELHKQGNVDAAIGEYQRALTLNTQSALAYYDLGVAYYQQHRIDQAISAYRQTVVLDPKMADAHFNLAYALSHDRREFREALAHFTTAIELNPKLAKAYFEMGIVYDALGIPARARSSYDIAVTLDSAFASVVPAHSTPDRQPQ